jgi:hypothetical protein
MYSRLNNIIISNCVLNATYIQMKTVNNAKLCVLHFFYCHSCDQSTKFSKKKSLLDTPYQKKLCCVN